MRAAAFAKRNLKELLRDPLTLFFGLGFPLVLLVLMNVIQRNVPVQIFALETLAPGIALFGLTFLACCWPGTAPPPSWPGSPPPP